jgi:predicted transcriptional regulator
MTPRDLQVVVACGTMKVMKPHKAMTIRLSSEQAEELELVAAVDSQPVSEVVRAAISEHIASRKNDRAFRDGLQQRIARAQKLIQE